MSSVLTFIHEEIARARLELRRHRSQALLFAAAVVSVPATVAVSQLLQLPYAVNNVEAMMTLLVVASPFLALAVWLTRIDWKFRIRPLDAAYGATMAVTLIWFFWTWGAFQPTRPFLSLFALFYLYILVRLLADRVLVPHLTLVAAVIVALVTGEALYGLAQRSAGLEMKGHFEHHNVLGMLLALAVPLALAQVTTRRYGHLYRVLFSGLTALLLWATVLTRCRTAIVALAIILPLMLVFYLRNFFSPLGKRLRLAIVASIVLVAVSLLALLAGPLYELSPISFWGRILSWKMGLRMLADHPILGVGFDTASRLLMDYQALYFSAGGGSELERLASDPVLSLFNEYLETAVDYGLVGLAVFLPFWYLTLKLSLQLMGRRKQAPTGGTEAGLPASLGGVERPNAAFGFAATTLLFMLMSFSYSTSHFRVLMVVFTVSLALVATMSTQAPYRWNRNLRRLMTATVAGGAILTAVFFGYSWLEKESLRQQQIAARQWEAGERDAALARLERAAGALHSHARFLAAYGERLREAGRMEEALGVLLRSQQLRSDPYTLEEVARVKAATGDVRGAIAAAERARAMLPWRLTVKDLLAGYYEDAGEATKAFEMRRELLLTPMKRGTPLGLELKTAVRQQLGRSPAVLNSEPPRLDSVSDRYRAAIRRALALAGDNAAQLQAALDRAEPAQRPALEFLIANMPEVDLATLDADFLIENLQLAFEARDGLPFVKDTSEQIFLNYVLPYSQADEPRHRWRADFRRRFLPAAMAAPDLAAAVETLNATIFEELGVGYTGRAGRGSPSPAESMARGSADCYGLSILLANACRAVGLPARITTIPTWVGISGGHGWVEVHDGSSWRFIGAFDRSPLDDTWFRERASLTDPSHWRHRIYAASFARTDIQTPHFGANVWWHDVTDFYRSLPPLEQPLSARSDEESRAVATWKKSRSRVEAPRSR